MALKVDFGTRQKVLITEVTESGKFFLQLDTPEAHGLSELSEKIRASAEASPEPLLHPEVRLKCYAQSAFDGVWYRALITAVSGGDVQVYYVDYGNTEYVPASNLNCPSGDFFSLPYQAVCCVLGDFTPRGGRWSSEATDALREAVPIETEFAAVFRSRNSSQKHPVYPSLPCFNVTLFSDPSTDRSLAEDLVGRGLGQYCICAENVSVGSTVKMFTCSIDSPGMFWLHISDKLEPINAVSDCLNNQETISSLKLLASSSLFPTAACCTHFSEDGMLYRSEIIKVGPDKVDVRYVDYGNCDTVDVQNILEIPADLVLQPAFAIQCCLDGVKPLKPKDRKVQSGAWSTDACDKFSELSEGRELEVEVVSEITPEVFSVRLRDVTSGDDIGQLLAREGYAELPEPVAHPKKKPTPQLQYVELQMGQRHKVIVTHAESPAVVWCQRTEYSLEFDHLMKDLEANHASFPPLRNPTVGRACCQPFYQDNSWCRGRVESVDDSSGTADVFFLDFGSTESLMLSDLRGLPPEYLSLPAQAVSFSVSGILPVGGGEWSDDAIIAFSELVIGKGLLCKVVGLDQDGYPAAQLRDPTTGNSDIGSELVRLGLAKGAPPTTSPAHQAPTPPSKSYQQNRPVGVRGSSASASAGSGSPRRQEQLSREGSVSSQRSHSQRNSPFPSPRGATPSQPSPSHKQAPKRPAYSCVKLTRGQLVEVFVTHVGSLTSFTCQVQASADQLQSLMDEIGKYCSSPQARAVVSPAPKVPVLALYSLDECWYRAVIKSLSGDECSVSFVDYGDSESLPLTKTRQIPPHFLELPAQALECSLYSLPPDYHSTPEATDALMDLVLEQCVSAVPRALLSGKEGEWQVDLATSEGSDVLEELTKLGHITKAKSPQSPVHKAAVNRSAPVSLPVIPVGSPVDVVVSFVRSSTHFCVQLMENYTTLERIISGMQKAFQNPIWAVDKPEIGMLCAAQFSEDKLWYRSKVVSISGKRAMVSFIDFGNLEEVDTSDLKILQGEFTADPCGAIPCALAGIPAEATSDAMATKFAEMVLNQNCKLVAEFSGPLTSLDSPVPVRLFDTKRSGVDSDVAKALLEAVVEKPRQASMTPRQASMTPRQASVTIPSVEPLLNTLCECVIVHVISPGEFYCQLWSEGDTHQTFTNEMYSFYGENGQGSKVTKPTVGTYCVALFDDGSWYRALVTGEPRGVMVDVVYIDYGNSGQVEIQDMRKIEPRFTTQRAQAVRCHLAGIVPPSGSWPEESCSKLYDSLIDEDVDVTFLAKGGEGEGYATRVQHGGQDVAEMLVKADLARVKTSNEEKAPLGSRPLDTPKVVCKPTTAPAAQLSIPAFHLETGQECDIMVTSSGSPSDFYCQVVDQQLDQMMEEIEEYCLDSPSLPSSHHLSSGDATLGQFTEDQGWYRAVITSVVDGGKLVKVRYIDYGNGETLPPSQLRAITPVFCQLPAFAIPCVLQGVEQFDIATDGESAFNHLILDGEFHLRCIAHSESLQHCHVQLERKENGENVLTEAVRQGILQPKAASVPPATATRPQAQQQMGDASLSIPMVFPRVDESPTWTVYVVHCESPDLFYCQFASPDGHDPLESLMAALQESYEQAPAVGANQLTIGSFVVAQFSEDEQWYRALVTSTTGEKVEVIFVDYGNRELLSLAKIRPIAKEFTHLPAQAVPCSLVAVKPLVGSDWSDKSTEVFLNLVIEKVLIARVGSPGDTSGGVYSYGDGRSLALSLALSSTEEGDVAAELVRLGQAKWSDATVDASPFDSTQPSTMAVEAARRLPVLQMAPGTKEVVYVSHVESPSSFWVQLASSEETLYSLTDSLAAVYNSPDAPRLIQPKTGDTCCAKFSVDQNWYRGVVQSCGSGVCLVRFVDYGNTESVNAQDLRSLQSEFCKLPVEGILCSLASCSPIGGSDWTDEAVSSFTSLAIDVPLDVEFITCTPQGVWEVRVQREGGTDVATKLVEMGVASASVQEAATQAVEGQRSVAQSASTPIEIPELTLVVGETYPMYMTHVVDPSEFYCQVATHSLTLDDLMARVADYYTEHRPQAVVEAGRYCVAQYSGNNAWYRAKVLRVTSQEEVSVYFVDYGNSEVVSTSQILALVPEFASLASQAISMCLPPEAIVEIESDQFFQLDLEQEFQVTPVSITDGRHIVKIQGDAATSLLLDAVLFAHPPTAMPSETTPVSSGACSPLVYPLGSTVDIYVSHVNSPLSFYCQPLDLVEELEEMMSQLANLVESSPPEQMKNPTLGQICLAKYSFDGEWYRARVEKFPSETEALVTFVDYGNSEVTYLGNLCVVPLSLMATQVQAFHCSVFEDLGTDWTWGEGMLEAFSSRVLQDSHFTLTILGQADDDRYLVEMSSDGHSIDFSHLLNGEEEIRPQAPLDIPNSVLATTTFRPIPPEEASALHSFPDLSLVAVKGSKTPSTEVETESENGGEEGEGEGEPLIRAPYMMGLSRQEVFEASVVHVQSPSLLYLQKVDCQPLVQALSDEINQYCASFPGRDFQHSFRSGDLVLAKYWLDEGWYRAKVNEVQQDGSAVVSFIDYGNVETIDPHDMIMCPESFLDLPAQAIPCSLAHVPRREEEWPEGYKELIDGLVEEKVMRATVVVPGSQGMRPTVTLEDMESGVDVSSQVLTKLQEECEVGAQESVYAAAGGPLTETRLDVAEEMAGGETKEQSAEEELKEQQPVSRPALPKRVFPVGDMCEVYLVTCTSPHSFVCQLARDEETIDSITTRLAQLYGEEGNSSHPLKAPPLTGDVLCAQFSEDHQWYRALVVETSEDQCEVVYLDFGNSETVTADCLRELDESLCIHPPMALDCFLHGVESPDKDGHFEDAAASKITELVGEEVATVEVMSVDSAGHLGVLLKNSGGMDVGADLIGCNLASPLVPTPHVSPPTPTLTAQEGMSSSELTPKAPEKKEPVLESPGKEEDESPIPVPNIPVPDPEVPIPDTQESLFAAGGSPLAETRPEITGGETNEVSAEEELGFKERQPVSRPALPTRAFAVGDRSDAYLVTCTSPRSFICQLARDEEVIESITADLAQLYGEDGNSSHPLKAPPVTGDVLCAQFSEDSQWYRALVVETSEDQCEVVYLDFGNSETVTADCLRELDESLCIHPPMALDCFLHGVESPDKDGQFEDAAASRITELVGEEVATVEVMSVDSAGHLGVLLKNSGGMDVGADLIGCNLASPLVPTPHVSPPTPTMTAQEGMSSSELTPKAPEKPEPVLESPGKEEDESPILVPKSPIPEQSGPLLEEGVPISDTVVSIGDQVPPIPDRPISSPDEAASEEDLNEQESSENLDSGSELTTSYPPLTLPPGTRASAIVASIASPDSFVVQLTENADAVVGLLDAIASEGYGLDDGSLKVKDPKPGLPVCAYFAEDAGWYRARIVSVDENSDSVTVQYVDYGNSDTVSVDRIKSIKPQFADPLPPQALTCSLPLLTERDLTPGISMSGDPWELEWPPSCTQHLTEMALDQDGLHLEIVDDSLTDGAYIVRLVDARGDQEIDIRERLVARLREPKTLPLTPDEGEEEEEEFHDALEAELGGGEGNQLAAKMAVEETEEEGDGEGEEFEDAAQFVDQTEQGSVSPREALEYQEAPVNTEEGDTTQPTAGARAGTQAQEPDTEEGETDTDATVPPLPTDSQPLEPTTEELKLKDSEGVVDGLTDPRDATGNGSPAPQTDVDILPPSPGAESAEDTKQLESDAVERSEGIQEQPGGSALSTEEVEAKEQGEDEGGIQDERKGEGEVEVSKEEKREEEKVKENGGTEEGDIQDEKEEEEEVKGSTEEEREEEEVKEDQGGDEEAEVKERAVDEDEDARESLPGDKPLPTAQSEQISQSDDNVPHSPPIVTKPLELPLPGEVAPIDEQRESGDVQTSASASELRPLVENPNTPPIQQEGNLTPPAVPKSEEAPVEVDYHDNKELGQENETADTEDRVPRLEELASGVVKAVSDRDETTPPRSEQLPEGVSKPSEQEKEPMETEAVPRLQELASGVVKEQAAVSDRDETTPPPSEQLPGEPSKQSEQEKEPTETEAVPRLQELASGVVKEQAAVSDRDETTPPPSEQQLPGELSKPSEQEKEPMETEAVPRLQELASGVVKEEAAVSDRDETTPPPSEQLSGELSKVSELEVVQVQDGGKLALSEREDDSFEIISPSESFLHQPQLIPPTTASDLESRGAEADGEQHQENVPEAKSLSLDQESASASEGQFAAQIESVPTPTLENASL